MNNNYIFFVEGKIKFTSFTIIIILSNISRYNLPPPEYPSYITLKVGRNGTQKIFSDYQSNCEGGRKKVIPPHR